MKIPLLVLFILPLEASRAVGTLIKGKNIYVVQIDEDTKVDEANGVISYPVEHGHPLKNKWDCNQDDYHLALTRDRKFATVCCLSTWYIFQPTYLTNLVLSTGASP